MAHSGEVEPGTDLPHPDRPGARRVGSQVEKQSAVVIAQMIVSNAEDSLVMLNEIEPSYRQLSSPSRHEIGVTLSLLTETDHANNT
jgi:F420-0:gamma-glutamyl ligase